MTPSRTVRSLLLLSVVAAVALGGCHRRHRHAMSIGARLDCPLTQGDLRRTEAAADGRSCRYAGPDGQEVTLAYLALDGRTPRQALAPTEAALRADVPDDAAPSADAAGRGDDAGASRDRSDADEGDDDGEAPSTPSPPAAPGAPAPPRAPEPPRIDQAWVAQASRPQGAHDRVRINLPFLHVDADGSGRAHVRTFGVSVDSDGDGALVSAPGGAVVDAHDGGAVLRFGAVNRDRTDLVFMIESKHPGPGGLRSAAYVAKGPPGGPLVLAVRRSPQAGGDHDHDAALRDVRRLVDLNVHGGHGFDIDVN